MSLGTVESAEVKPVMTSRPSTSRAHRNSCINSCFVPTPRCLLQPAAAQQALSRAKGARRVQPPAVVAPQSQQKEMSTQSGRPVPSGAHSCSCLSACLPGPGPCWTQQTLGCLWSTQGEAVLTASVEQVASLKGDLPHLP